MGDIIKKKFKCKMCKHVYPITIDMIKDKKYGYSEYGRTYFEYVKGFNCPVCGLTYDWDDGRFIKWQPSRHMLYDV